MGQHRTNLGLAAAAHSRAQRPKFHVSARLFYLTFGGLLLTNAVTLVGFLMAPDVARLVGGQNEQVLNAYEDRLAELRIEVDRLHSRKYAQAGDINLQLQELAQQQELLTEQHQYVKALAEKAAALGLTDTPGAIAAAPPQPVTLPTDAPEDLAQAEQAVGQMLDESRLALATISTNAEQSTQAIVDQLSNVGIRVDLGEDETAAMGGPFLPPQDGPDADDIVDQANAAMTALVRFKAARGAIEDAPVHQPLNSERVSSTFGNRKDPFTGRRAFHAGIDFAAPWGSTVLSAGAGTVVYVGQRSGYGNVVEIDHGDGLITRYGHLSGFLVKEGQVVATGAPIAKVGSTGRSTGPHLHFEVRRNDAAVNPAPFLKVGEALERFAAV